MINMMILLVIKDNLLYHRVRVSCGLETQLVVTYIFLFSSPQLFLYNLPLEGRITSVHTEMKLSSKEVYFVEALAQSYQNPFFLFLIKMRFDSQ